MIRMEIVIIINPFVFCYKERKMQIIEKYIDKPHKKQIKCNCLGYFDGIHLGPSEINKEG